MELVESERDSLVVNGASETSLWRKHLVQLGLVSVAVVSIAAITHGFSNPAKEVKASMEDLISEKVHIPGYCAMMQASCDTVFSEAADSLTDCQVDIGEADGVCEVEGGGPEDPDSDVCAAAFTGAIEAACDKAVKAGTNFGSTQCLDAVGCGCKPDSVSDGQSCSRGQDSCCQNGAVCGRYSDKKHKYQCCMSSNEVGGVAWCANGAGGECSDGNDDNCESGYVCGRYNNQKKDYQCCSGYQVIGGVAWCANPVGGACSDGEDNNCMGSAVCGQWPESSSDYACCTDYSTPNGVAVCNSV